MDLEANTEVKVRVGQFVDVADCFTPETGVTLGAADEAELLKHNGVATVDISGNTWAAIASCDGWYDLTLTTTDTNTEGLLTVVVQDDSVCLPVHAHFMVLAQAAWDSKYTAKDTGYMDVDAKAISGSTAAADNVESVFLGTGHTDDVDLSARKLKLDSDTDVALEVLSSDDSAIKAISSSATKHGMELGGGSAGDGLHAAGGAQGNGIEAVGGSTAGYGINAYGQATNSIGIAAVGDGNYAGLYITGGVNGEGVRIVGGSTSGDGILITATDGDGISVGHGGSNYDIDADIHGTIDTVTTATDAETKLDAVIADTEDLQTQIGTAGAGLTDLGGMSTGMKAEIESEVDDGLVANNLDHLCKTATSGADMTAEVVDNSILSRVLASGDTSAFDPTTDSLQDIYDKIGAASPANFTPATGSTITHGTETNAYTDCATDDGTRWQAVDPEDTNPIEVLCKFALGTTHSATGLTINGYFNRDGGTAIVEIYAYNYTTSTWDKLSAGTVNTEMRDSAVDKDYSFSLSYGHTKTTATVGEVQIKFLSTVAHAVDVLHLDYVAIEGQPTGAIDPDTIASAVWTHEDGHDVSRHIPKYVGHVWYVDTAGSDANEGLTVHEALATLAEAISQGSAGDRIIVKAGSYTEAGTDLSKAGMEIHAEYGTIMTGGGGTGLVVSANNCKIENLWITPAAGQIGFDITGNHGRFINCESYSSGATGFRTGTAAGQSHFTNCSSRKYTTAGFELQGASATLLECQAMTQTGSSTIGFHLSNAAADRCSLIRCNSINNGTNSFLVVSGADENLFVDCADSDTCGAASDSGTNNAWRNYKDSDIVAADVSASLATHDGKLDTVDGIVDAILADTVEIQGTGFSTATDSLVHIHDDHVTHITAAYGSAQKALIDGLPSGIAKGVELADFTFPMILSSDHETYATGKTVTEEISKDGGNYAACTNSASEIQSSGTYKITLTATEMNANIVTLRFTETDCDTTGVTIITT